MNTQRFGIILTIVNLFLLVLLGQSTGLVTPPG